MIELREDGSRPGTPTVARIYKIGTDEGTVDLRIWNGEFVTDLPDWIEKSDHFRGWVTEFFDIGEVKVKLEELYGTITDEERAIEKTRFLKEEFLKEHRKAEKAAYAYFASCEPGPERLRAWNIYENIRTALITDSI